jgi:hypothetical protein
VISAVGTTTVMEINALEGHATGAARATPLLKRRT